MLDSDLMRLFGYLMVVIGLMGIALQTMVLWRDHKRDKRNSQ